MGGFKLFGPNFTIQNKKPSTSYQCRCPGFIAKIDQTLENYFLNKPEKFLDIHSLPNENLIRAMSSAHLGEEMNYDIYPNREEINYDMYLNRTISSFSSF